MSPFKRGKYWSLYVPRRSGGVVQRACGTTDAKLAKQMGRMIDQLADQKQWSALEAIDQQIVTVAEAYDAFRNNRLDTVIADKTAPELLTFVETWADTLSVGVRTKPQYLSKMRRMIPAGMKATAFSGGWAADTIANLTGTFTNRALSPGTKRAWLHVLSMFGDYLVAHRVIPMNPVSQKGLVRRPRTNPPRKVWMTEDVDVALVRATTHAVARAYFALVHSSGAERDAALMMRRRDIDADTWTCHIPGTKNAGRNRYGIPMEPWSKPFLLPRLNLLLPDAMLFEGLSREHVQDAHVLARQAIQRPQYQLRDARHSYACRALLRGEPLWKVSKWLGHSNVAITAKVYAEFGLDAALEALGRTAAADLNLYATSGTT